MVEQRDIVIIGGGASATLLAHALRRHHGLECMIVNDGPWPASGVAYGTRCIGHLLNVPASGMSGVADDPDHFVNWLHRQIDPGIDRHAFMPRAIYSLYLHHLLRESAARLRQDKADSCTIDAQGFLIGLACGKTIAARSVVLALGHFPPAILRGITSAVLSDPRYHHNVWHDAGRSDDLHQTSSTTFGRDETLVMIGSGLTAVDMVMKARLEGHEGAIKLLSRHAVLPEQHCPVDVPEKPVVTPEANEALLSSYVRQFHAALNTGMTWRAAIDSLRPVTNDLWKTLNATERARFNRHLRRRWDVARHRIAPQIASFLHRELQAGSLTITAGHIVGIETGPDGLVVTAEHEGETHHYRADHVLNCTGPDPDYRHAGSPLLDGLMACGAASPGQKGAGLDSCDNGQLIDRSGQARLPLYTLGPARLGTLFESIAIPEIRQQAYDLAGTLAIKHPLPQLILSNPA